MSRDKKTENRSKTNKSSTIINSTDLHASAFSRRRRMRRSVANTAMRAAWF